MNEIIVAALALCGTVIGSITGILASNKLVSYRIEQLEKKVEKLNDLVERVNLAEAGLKAAHKRLDELIARQRT